MLTESSVLVSSARVLHPWSLNRDRIRSWACEQSWRPRIDEQLLCLDPIDLLHAVEIKMEEKMDVSVCYSRTGAARLSCHRRAPFGHRRDVSRAWTRGCLCGQLKPQLAKPRSNAMPVWNPDAGRRSSFSFLCSPSVVFCSSAKFAVAFPPPTNSSHS
jgi:hypothetical protein